MITVERAMEIINEKFPNRKIVGACKYKGYYLFEVPDRSMEVDYSDPFFLVDKISGKVLAFLPTMDLEGFGDAMAHHRINIKE